MDIRTPEHEKVYLDRHRKNLGMPNATEQEIEDEYAKRLKAKRFRCEDTLTEFWFIGDRDG